MDKSEENLKKVSNLYIKLQEFKNFPSSKIIKEVLELPEFKGIKVTRDFYYEITFFKGISKYTVAWSKYSSNFMVIEDLVRIYQVLNHIEINGVYNTLSLIDNIKEYIKRKEF